MPLHRTWSCESGFSRMLICIDMIFQVALIITIFIWTDFKRVKKNLQRFFTTSTFEGRGTILGSGLYDKSS